MSIRRYFDELKLRLMIDPNVEMFEVISKKVGEKELEELELENTKTIESVHDAITNDR